MIESTSSRVFSDDAIRGFLLGKLNVVEQRAFENCLVADDGLEARVRLKQFGGNFGVVPFFDGGSLTTQGLPNFKDWRFAAGLGVRYYSSFGPIRIDFGVPLNRDKGDGRFAVTVSLGQAF